MSMRGLREELFPVLGITLAVAVACGPLIIFGPQHGRSLDFELAWASHFSQQLFDGELYPRWLLSMNEGAGSPVFFFYAPIGFYFTALGFVLCGACPTTTQLGIGEWLIIVGSGFSFYLFARQQARPMVSMLGAILYALAPYHFPIDLLSRQAIGEAAAYVWIPMLWLFMDKMLAGERAIPGLALAYALLVATHLPAALLVSLLALVYVAVRGCYELSQGVILRFFVAITLGIMVAGLYLVPALLSQEYVSMAQMWGPYYHYDRWFLLDGVAAPDPRFETALLVTLALYTVVFAALCIVGYRNKDRRRRVVTSAWLIVFACACFLMLPLSRPVWEYVPFLKQVQFPWRVFTLLDMAIAAGIIHILPSNGWPHRPAGVIAGAVISLFAASAMLVTVNYVRDWALRKDGRNQAMLREAVKSGLDAGEYLPSWVTASRAATLGVISSMDRVRVDPTTGTIDVTRWQPRHIELNIRMAREGTLVVRQFYYPGWEATIAGTRLRINPSSPAGLIELSAPAGHYVLSVRLQRLWQETVGAVLSGIGLAGVVMLGFGQYLRERGWLARVMERRRSRGG